MAKVKLKAKDAKDSDDRNFVLMPEEEKSEEQKNENAETKVKKKNSTPPSPSASGEEDRGSQQKDSAGPIEVPTGEETMSDQDLSLDDILTVLENPTRRKILEKLTKETHYPLQLSKELNVSQQAIMKHLKVLEQYGLVLASEEPSTSGGPPRKCYLPTRNLSIRIDIGPNTFEAKMRTLDKDQAPMLLGEGEVQEIPKEYARIQSNVEDPHEKLTELTKLIEKVDAQLVDMENQRTYLAQMRERLLQEVYAMIAQLAPDYNERKVLYYVVRTHNTDIPAISEALDIREKVLMDLFKSLRREQLYWWD